MHWLFNYRRSDLIPDILCAITLASLQIPESMAYSMLAGMPPIYGLYSSVLPLVIYSLFGTSRTMNVGPVSVESILINIYASQIMQTLYPGTDPKLNEQLYINIVLLMSFITGLFMIIFALIQLPLVLSKLLPKPLTEAFSVAYSCVILVSQFGKLVGIVVPVYSGFFNLFYSIRFLLVNLSKANISDLILVIISFGLLFSLKLLNHLTEAQLIPIYSEIVSTKNGLGKVKNFFRKVRGYVPIPEVLVVVGSITTVVYLFGLYLPRAQGGYGIEIIGPVPQGFPQFNVLWSQDRFCRPSILNSTSGEFNCPAVSTVLQETFFSSLFLALICISFSSAIAKIYSKEFDDENITPMKPLSLTQDTFFLGVSASLSSFLTSSFLACGSMSRSALVFKSGGRTPLVGLITAFTIAIVFLKLTFITEYIPKSLLASVVIFAISHMFLKFQLGFEYISRVICQEQVERKNEVRGDKIQDVFNPLLFWVTFLCCFILDLTTGLGIGIILSMMISVCNSFRKLFTKLTIITVTLQPPCSSENRGEEEVELSIINNKLEILIDITLIDRSSHCVSSNLVSKQCISNHIQLDSNEALSESSFYFHYEESIPSAISIFQFKKNLLYVQFKSMNSNFTSPARMSLFLLEYVYIPCWIKSSSSQMRNILIDLSEMKGLNKHILISIQNKMKQKYDTKILFFHMTFLSEKNIFELLNNFEEV